MNRRQRGGPKRPPPLRQLETAAQQLHRLAERTTEALTHIRQELSYLDGHPTRNDNEHVTGGGGHNDPTIRQAFARAQLENQRKQIEHWIHDINHLLDTGGRLINRTLTTRAPTSETPDPKIYCRDGSHGKDLTPELLADIIACWEIPHKSGLCNRHYMAWWRERENRGDPKTRGGLKKGGRIFSEAPTSEPPTLDPTL